MLFKQLFDHDTWIYLLADPESREAIMNGLNLAHPRRIHEALPANMTCGLPEARAEKVTPGLYKEIDVGSVDLSAVNRVVDVRSPEEFEGELGHLPGAVLAPLSQLSEHVQTWRRETPLLVVCRSGRRSAQACTLLSEMGFPDVTNLTGGMIAWRAQQEVTSC